MTIQKVYDILPYQLDHYPLQDSLAKREDGKSWTYYSTQKLLDLSDQLAQGLIELGLQKGDKIGIVTSHNQVEWHIIDRAASQIGVITVPLYPTISSHEYVYILNHSEAKYLFVSDAILYKKIKPIRQDITQLKEIYSIHSIPGLSNWKELLPSNPQTDFVENIKKEISEEDIVTIIYTSGTTGNPKGVMLSHKNIISNVLDCTTMIPMHEQQKALSFLPLCHVFERMLNYTYMYKGIRIYQADGFETIPLHLMDIKPQYFATVPRILEKIYEKALTKSKKLPQFQRAIFLWSVRLASSTPINNKITLFQKIQLAIAYYLVLKKWKLALGGEILAIVSGSAPLNPNLTRLFNHCDIPVIEGYGLTETSPVLTVNPLLKYKIIPGSVGVTLPSVQIRIADDGEILAKGPNIMHGYYQDEKSTQESFTADGWFKTGDIGHFNQKNYLIITDRKKELLKTSGGKYVAPLPIENKLKESPYIEQVVVVGDGKKFVSALIVPNFDILKTWCNENKILYKSKDDIITNSRVNKMFLDIVRKNNTNFSNVEQIKRIALLKEEWTIESGELTATMKIKRKTIRERYHTIIESFYR